MPRHARFIRAAAAAIALVVASCATGDRAAPTPGRSERPARPTATSTTPPTSIPGQSPTPLPSEAVLTALPEGGSQVFPGRYTTHFAPALTLSVDRQVKIDCAPGYRCRGDVDVNLPNWLDIEF